MTEKGRVREINGDLVIVATDMSATCFGCMNQECKSQGGIIKAENPNALPLKTGQLVELEAPGKGIVGQALAAFLPPALSFITGFLLIRYLFPKAGEGAAAAISVVILFATAYIIYRIRKSKPVKNEFLITRVLE